MRSTIALLIVLGIAVLGCDATEKSQQPSSDDSELAPSANTVKTEAELVADLERFVDRLVLADQFSGAVLLARHGMPMIRRSYGLADRAEMRGNTPETPFALGSVSKMFTAVLIAQLLEQNKLSTDATIGEILPSFPVGPAKDRVTVQHLLTMSSGIPDVFQLPEFINALGRAGTLSDFWPVFASKPLSFTPGTRWTYSNSNFLVLGAIVEQTLGEPFVALVERRIFQPSGMASTSYQPPASVRPARGYTSIRPGGPGQSNGDAWTPAWDEKRGAPVVHVPMGGGWSTVDDLARFADALMHSRLVRRETMERVMTGVVPADYGGRDGYGFETRVVNGVRIVGHQGGAPGVSNQVDFYPDLGYVMIVLGNSDASGAQEIAKQVRTTITSLRRAHAAG
jgi:CubicO group peptidase (beta-lactamase class C family)